jgi:polar amino acid transport system permease protein
LTKRAFKIQIPEVRVLAHLDWRLGLGLLAAFVLSLGAASAQPARLSAIETLIVWLPYILKGFSLNLIMSFAAMILATVLGVALGLMQISLIPVVKVPSRFLTSLMRNSPWLVILFVVMYVLPSEFRLPGGWKLTNPDWVKATIAFALPTMGNISEIVRGAVRSIPVGQWESAEGLAFTRSQTLRYVVLPQCVRRSLPSWMNWYAMLTLSTPMAAIFSVREAVASSQAAMEAAGARPEFLFPFYLFLLCLFFAYIWPIAIWTRKLERNYVA